MKYDILKIIYVFQLADGGKREAERIKSEVSPYQHSNSMCILYSMPNISHRVKLFEEQRKEHHASLYPHPHLADASAGIKSCFSEPKPHQENAIDTPAITECISFDSAIIFVILFSRTLSLAYYTTTLNHDETRLLSSTPSLLGCL